MPHTAEQHKTMIEAVVSATACDCGPFSPFLWQRHLCYSKATVDCNLQENHTPEAIIIDEIGTAEEAHAARTIAQRGVQLIATAHGGTSASKGCNSCPCQLLASLAGVSNAILAARQALNWRISSRTPRSRSFWVRRSGRDSC